MSLEYIETCPRGTPEILIIWLHGLGADGHDFQAIVPELRLPDAPAVRFVFPHAPFRPITLNNGYVMRGWYDVSSLDFGTAEDEQGIRETADLVHRFIDQQRPPGMPSRNIILAGFSQGGAIALHTALRYPEPLGGIMALSCYLPLADSLEAEIQENNIRAPIFMAHGLQDEIVQYRYGAYSRQRLLQAGCQIDWHDYTMGHSVCADEISDIRQWLLNVVG